MNKFDPKYGKIACKLLEQLASEKLTFEEARRVIAILETKLKAACVVVRDQAQ